jgi:hypothetical protein
MRAHLFNLYDSNNQKPKNSPNQLQKWVKIHAETGSITKIQDINCYYRELTAQATSLQDMSFIMVTEANLLFYKGIPSSLHKNIRQKIPDVNQTAMSARRVETGSSAAWPKEETGTPTMTATAGRKTTVEGHAMT